MANLEHSLETRMTSPKAWLLTASGLAVWVLIYNNLTQIADTAAGWLPIDRRTPFGDAVHFFIYEVPKVLLLLTLVVYAMGVIRSFFSPERTRALLAGRREGVGNVLAVFRMDGARERFDLVSGRFQPGD